MLPGNFDVILLKLFWCKSHFNQVFLGANLYMKTDKKLGVFFKVRDFTELMIACVILFDTFMVSMIT